MKLTPNQINALYYFTTDMRVFQPDTRTVNILSKKRLIKKTKTIGLSIYWEPTKLGLKISNEHLYSR